jgi:hypothetical protein
MPAAMLQLVEHDNHISLMVEDDGVGIEDYWKAPGKAIKIGDYTQLHAKL